MAKSASTATDTRTVTSAELLTELDHIVFNRRRPSFVWGPPGIGKSDIVHQLAERHKRPVVDVRLSLWEPTDIKGIPYFDSVKETMRWAPPAELPTDPKSNAVLFLDELNSAPPAVQAAAYQLILNRKVGVYELPKGVDVIAAGNRESDRGVTYRMPDPLVTRLVHFELRADHECWMQWAVDNHLHPEVIGYVASAKQHFAPGNALATSKSRTFPTPRGWYFTSEALQDSDHLSESMLTDIVAGIIGDGVAHEFIAHRKIAAHMPKPGQVLDGAVTKFEVREMSAMYSLAISMCYELKDRWDRAGDDKKKTDACQKNADNFIRFSMDNFPTEMVVLAARTALNTYGLPINPGKLKNFAEFHQRFGKYVLNSVG